MVVVVVVVVGGGGGGSSIGSNASKDVREDIG